MRLLLVIALLLLVGHRAADAGKCKRKGTVLFRETVGPLRDAAVDTADVPRAKLTIWKTGAWEKVSPDGPAHGCLAKKHLAALSHALAKAEFALDTTGLGTCRAIPTAEVVYASPKRKKRVVTAQPCGTPVDEWTANLAVCAEHAGSAANVGEIVMLCRGEDPMM